MPATLSSDARTFLLGAPHLSPPALHTFFEMTHTMSGIPPFSLAPHNFFWQPTPFSRHPHLFQGTHTFSKAPAPFYKASRTFYHRPTHFFLTPNSFFGVPHFFSFFFNNPRLHPTPLSFPRPHQLSICPTL